MQRKSLILSLSLVYAATAATVGGWAAAGFIGSTSTAFAAVQGVSTASLASASNSVNVAAYPTINPGAPKPYVQAKEYALYDPQSGVMVAQSADQSEVPIASTTKMMTAHIASLYGNLNDYTTISPGAADIEGSVAGLKAGETIQVRNLLYCLLLPSGNDAAHALAEYTGGVLLHDQNASADAKTARFVQAMNAEAARLHMDHTHYLDPAGLNDGGHSTATDLTKIASVDLADPNIQPVMNTADITVTDQSGSIQHVLHNSDRLVADYHYPGSIGGKTGFTPAAGHCLMSGATQNGRTLIAMILNTDDTAADASAIQAQNLLNWGFANVSWQ